MSTLPKPIDHLYKEFHSKYSYDEKTGIFKRKADKSIAGCVNVHGYVQINLNSKLYLGHRIAWLMSYGSVPSGIDHIDSNRSNNRISNLRPADKRQNAYNRPHQRNSLSGLKGVHFSKRDKKWIAAISIDGKQTSLGYFNSSIEAARSYDAAAKQNHGEYAYVNGV